MTKTWKAGSSENEKHRAICDRDILNVHELVSRLSYYIDPEVSHTFEDQTDGLRKFTAAEIIDGLVAYRDSRITALQNGLDKGMSKEEILYGVQARYSERLNLCLKTYDTRVVH